MGSVDALDGNVGNEEQDRTRSSRRALLGAAAGALAAVGAEAIGRPLATRAANGDAVKAGMLTSATSTTEVLTTAGTGFWAGTSAVGSAALRGVHTASGGGWHPGVYGRSETLGMEGESTAGGLGVHGITTTGIGVSGESTVLSDIGIGVSGRAISGIGVLGYSGSSASLPPKTGVHGYAAHDKAARGTSGETDMGHGVHGGAIDGIGVYGDSLDGDGVHGVSVSSNGTSGSSGSNIASGVYGENTAGGYGVYGRSNVGQGYGVFGESTSGFGVWGKSISGKAVYGESTNNVAVQGTSSAAGAPAAFGRTFGDNTGVMGYSGPGGPPPASPAKTGVFGYAAQDASASGVVGRSTLGTGVQGIATSGVGVLASADAGGTALRAQGRVNFSTSGLSSFTVGTSILTITPGTNIGPTSRILCTLESSQSGLAIQRITRNSSSDIFKVYLSTTLGVGKTAKVNWFVIG